jgi:pimeloyl-ACP methyl ester carboxylesterase
MRRTGYGTADRGTDVLSVLDRLGVSQADVIGHGYAASRAFALATRRRLSAPTVLLVGDHLLPEEAPEAVADAARALFGPGWSWASCAVLPAGALSFAPAPSEALVRDWASYRSPSVQNRK